MAQKSFTMWPRTKSSMANTVSFLTAVDNRFIVFGFLSYGAHTSGFGLLHRHGAALACNTHTSRLGLGITAWRGST